MQQPCVETILGLLRDDHGVNKARGEAKHDHSELHREHVPYRVSPSWQRLIMAAQ